MERSQDSITGVETTAMAIREELMMYFKGTCVRRLTVHNGINLQHYSEGHSNRYYERRQVELADTRLLYLYDVPIIKLSRDPLSILFYMNHLNRSKQFREVYTLLDGFMAEYLQGVERNTIGDETPKGRRDDTEAVSNCVPILEEQIHTAQAEWEMIMPDYAGAIEMDMMPPRPRGTTVTMNTVSGRLTSIWGSGDSDDIVF